MKRTLLICSTYPFPETTGGRMRTANFVRYFRRFGSVDVAYWQETANDILDIKIIRNNYRLDKLDYPAKFLGRTIAILKGRPYPIHMFSRESVKTLFSIVEINNYDFIVIRYVENAYHFFKLPLLYRKRIIVDFDDIFTDSLYELLFSASKNIFKSLLHALNKNALLRYEKKCLRLGLPIFSSKFDKDRTIGNNANASVVPNVYINETFNDYDFGNGYDISNTILFVGTLTYKPNLNGLSWFIDNIYSDFKRKVPDAKLLVVGYLGNASGDKLRQCCLSVRDIELHTDVPDIKEYYKACRFVVVPLLQGGGTRIKIIEAAMAHRPVLSTPIGATGLNLTNGRDILLFSDKDEFMRAFDSISEKKVYEALVKNAFQTVHSDYSIYNFNIALDKTIRKV